jgi:acetyltransferase-like isoleucine patch superfamily enzyme
VRAINGGRLDIGDGVLLSRFVELEAKGGELTIGCDTFVGQGSCISAHERTEVGAGCMIAEYVSIRDFDHAVNEMPIRRSGIETLPIKISGNVWIGAKTTVLRGSVIGYGAVVGANSVVKGHLPDGAIAVGAPAKQIKSRPT